MNPLNRTLTCALVMCVIVTLVHGNGRLLVPPQRSSLWRDPAFYRSRYVFKNYDDHTLNCGGFWKMHENDGKCGLCGDPWDEEEPRPNEAGGIYGRGIIGRTYSTDKRFIDVVVQVTSSMGGYFEFNICPHNDVKTRVTKECLDEFPMRILSKDQTTSYGRRYIPDITAGRAGIVELALEIPDGMECTQCVLQWRWHGGNNYGICRNGQWGKGCGEQPEIYNCADIAILPDYKEEEPNGHKEIDMNGGRPWTPKPATRKPEITTPKAKESVTTTVASKLTTTAAPKTTARRRTTTAASTTTVESATDKPVNITTTPVERSTGKPVTTTTFLPEIIISTKMPERITTDKQEMSTNETLLVSTTERAAGKPITTTMLPDIITSTKMPESVTTDKQEISTNDTLVSTTERAAGKPITTTMLPDINISTKMPERVTTEKQEISTNETLLVSTTESAKGKPITTTMLPDIIISTKLPERVTTEKQEIEISTNKTLLASTTVSLVNTETNVPSNTTQDAQESTSRQDMTTTQLPTTTNTLTVNNNSTNLADRKDINTTIPSLLNITTANIETSTKQSDGQTEGEETSISPVSTSIPVVPVTASEKQQKETSTNSSTAANKPTTVTLEIPSTQFKETSTVIQVTEVVKQQTDISNNDTLAVNYNTTVKPQTSSAKSPNQETTQAINTTTKQALDLINAEVLTTNSVALQNSSTVPTTSVSTTVNETSDKITKSDKSEITTGQPTTMAFIQTNNQSTDSSNSQNNNQSTTTAVISEEKSSESTTTEQPSASVAVNGSDLEMTTPREVVTTPFISTNTSRQMLTGNSSLIVETTTDMANDGGSSVKPVSLNNATSTMNTTTPDVNILKNTPEGFGTTQQKLSSSSTVPLVTGSKLSTSTSTPTTSSTVSFTTTENSLISLLDDIANLADLKSNEILDFVNQTSGNNTSLAEDGKTMKSVSTVQTSSTDNTTTASPVSTNATDSSVFTSKTSVSRTTRLARPTGGRFGGGINVATLFPVDNIVNIDLNIPGGDANAEKQAVPAN